MFNLVKPLTILRIFTVLMIAWIVISFGIDIVYPAIESLDGYADTHALVVIALVLEMVSTFFLYRATFVKPFDMKQRKRTKIALVLQVLSSYFRGFNECSTTFNVTPLILSGCLNLALMTGLGLVCHFWVLELEEFQELHK